MSSVRPSVCPSVTLVDQDHISWKSWKLIARTISPTPSLFVAQEPSSYSQGNIATDFYMAEEIKEAVAAVYSHVEQRPPAYKGTDKDRKTVEGILKLFLNPNIELPTFVAVDISRLPPVSVDHMDTSALLQELALLRSEVRAIGAIRAELDEMKAAVKTLQQSVSLTLLQGPDRSSVKPVIGAVQPISCTASAVCHPVRKYSACK